MRSPRPMMMLNTSSLALTMGLLGGLFWANSAHAQAAAPSAAPAAPVKAAAPVTKPAAPAAAPKAAEAPKASQPASPAAKPEATKPEAPKAPTAAAAPKAQPAQTPKAAEAPAPAAVKAPVNAAAPAAPAAVAAPKADPKAQKAAKKALTEGDKAYKASDYATALTHFQESDALLPSAAAEFYAADCLDKLGRLDEALPAYGKFLANTTVEKALADKRTAAEARVTQLNATVPG